MIGLQPKTPVRRSQHAIRGAKTSSTRPPSRSLEPGTSHAPRPTSATQCCRFSHRSYSKLLSNAVPNSEKPTVAPIGRPSWSQWHRHKAPTPPVASASIAAVTEAPLQSRGSVLKGYSIPAALFVHTVRMHWILTELVWESDGRSAACTPECAVADPGMGTKAHPRKSRVLEYPKGSLLERKWSKVYV